MRFNKFFAAGLLVLIFSLVTSTSLVVGTGDAQAGPCNPEVRKCR